jgi:hypothetical protein
MNDAARQESFINSFDENGKKVSYEKLLKAAKHKWFL